MIEEEETEGGQEAKVTTDGDHARDGEVEIRAEEAVGTMMSRTVTMVEILELGRHDANVITSRVSSLRGTLKPSPN